MGILQFLSLSLDWIKLNSSIALKTFWVLLFICGVVWAVEFALVESLSISEIILGIQRLSTQRGLLEVIFSNNKIEFTASHTALPRQFVHVATEWKFIASHSHGQEADRRNWCSQRSQL